MIMTQNKVDNKVLLSLQNETASLQKELKVLKDRTPKLAYVNTARLLAKYSKDYIDRYKGMPNLQKNHDAYMSHLLKATLDYEYKLSLEDGYVFLNKKLFMFPTGIGVTDITVQVDAYIANEHLTYMQKHKR